MGEDCDVLCEHQVELEELRAAVANHREELVASHRSVTSTDTELWACAGIEEHYPGWQHPVRRLQQHIEHLRTCTDPMCPCEKASKRPL